MSELRQDLTSGDWIISAPARAKRPELLLQKKKPRKPAPKKNCPFEDLKKSGNWPLILTSPPNLQAGGWRIAVINNKYSALSHEAGCALEIKHGPYRLKTGAGEHNVLITADHYKNFADLSPARALEVFQVLQERYRAFAKDKCALYVSTFFNWGPAAGASLYHPHYQLLALPIIPPHIKSSLFGSLRFFREHGKCARCTTIKYDSKEKKRIIEENSQAIALAPFVSRKPFEIRIFPKKHVPSFEETSLPDLRAVASTLQSVLRRMKKHLRDPDFNFFIHSTPFDGRRKYRFHHWHIEVIPQITILGGFELSTGIDINIVDPVQATAILRGKK